MTSLRRRCGPLVSVSACVWASTLGAINLDVTPGRMEAALRVARGSEAERAAFHRAYVLALSNPIVERMEVVTELRRVVQMAEERIAIGDHMFAATTRSVQEAIQPWRRRVSLIARLRFPPLNAYVMAPPVDVVLQGPSGDVPRLENRSEPLLGLASGAPGEQLPVLGVVAEAVFDAAVVGQIPRTVSVRMSGKELARMTIDFGRLE